MATLVKPDFAQPVNDGAAPIGHGLRMTDAIHKSRQPNRPHYVPAWAERRGLRQSDIAEAIGVDKATVSRWFSGSTPSEPAQIALARLFECDDREAIFRHPDDDWMARFFSRMSDEHRERARNMLEAAFPEYRVAVQK